LMTSEPNLEDNEKRGPSHKTKKAVSSSLKRHRSLAERENGRRRQKGDKKKFWI